MRLWFENSLGKAKVIAKIDGRKNKRAIQDEAFGHIKAYCDERYFKIWYIRIWEEEWRGRKATAFDVGSHTEFFYLTK